MNNKGQFFSIAGVLIVLILVVVLGAQSAQVRGEEDLRVSRATAHVMDGFARNFATLDVPHTLHTASRIALTRSSQTSLGPLSREEFVEIMRTGSLEGSFVFDEVYATNAHFLRIVGTLPFARQDEMVFDYELLLVEQIADDTLRLTYNVSYTLSADQRTWTEPGEEFVVHVSVLGVRHPAHSAVIDERWEPDEGCLARLLFSDMDSCQGNMRPPEEE